MAEIERQLSNTQHVDASKWAVLDGDDITNDRKGSGDRPVGT